MTSRIHDTLVPKMTANLTFVPFLCCHLSERMSRYLLFFEVNVSWILNTTWQWTKKFISFPQHSDIPLDRRKHNFCQSSLYLMHGIETRGNSEEIALFGTATNIFRSASIKFAMETISILPRQSHFQVIHLLIDLHFFSGTLIFVGLFGPDIRWKVNLNNFLAQFLLINHLHVFSPL